MTDMIERVARALAKADPCGDPDWDYTEEAIAAIKAMREPTDEMVNIGEHCADGCYKIDPCGKGAEHIFITMIDAALGENK